MLRRCTSTTAAAARAVRCRISCWRPLAEDRPLPTVGARLLAKVVNDDVGILIQRSALRFVASKLAPTDGTGIGA
ncbi:hypothetical protein CEC48_11855 [Pseudomonas sp. K2I15]|nr:hypothetical protein CEC48_11855 [Pseudomonas sp. K2I15]